MDVARELPPDATMRLKGRTATLVDGVDAALLWCNRRLQNRRVWLCAVLAVLAVQIALIVTHRAWLDEWQALEIAVQSPSFAALLDNLRYEGHPPLWYLLLRGASWLATPRFALLTVELPIALALQLLILLKLPLARLERIFFSLNFYVVIDYAATSRPLGLGVLLFLAAILFRERRLAWAAIALLPMVDFLFGILSLGCLAIYWREKRLWAPGLASWLVFAIAAAWAVRPAPDVVPAIVTTVWWHDFGMELSRFGSVLFPLQTNGHHFQWDGDLPFLVGAPLGISFLALGARLCADRFSKLLFTGFCALLLGFSVAVYPLSSRHLSLAGVLLLILVAIGPRRGCQRFLAPLRIWLASAALLGVIAAAVNLAEPFDTSAEAAAYIRSHGLTAKHWAVYPDFQSQGLSALDGMEFHSVQSDCMQTFVRWNHKDNIKTYAQLERALRRISARGGSYYLVSSVRLPMSGLFPHQAYRRLAYIASGYDGKDYFLYRVRPELAEQPSHVPQCSPGLLPFRLGP